MDFTELRHLAEQIETECGKAIIGKGEQIRLVLTSLFAGGHVLIDDIPGVGKTTLVKALSAVLGCGMVRVQFTPDLLPSDIVGMNIYSQKTGEMVFTPGPIMTNILLADEINRAIPRTQSALLEAMEERQVSVDGVTYPLAPPFMVLATQNPVETETTFALPAAQLDRFLFKLSMGYPTPREEAAMLRTVGDGAAFADLRPLLSPEEVNRFTREIRQVRLSDPVVAYIVELVQATREQPELACGASPRVSRDLFRASKAYAALSGRDYVTPDDVKYLARYVLPHRVLLSHQAALSGLEAAAWWRPYWPRCPAGRPGRSLPMARTPESAAVDFAESSLFTGRFSILALAACGVGFSLSGRLPAAIFSLAAAAVAAAARLWARHVLDGVNAALQAERSCVFPGEPCPLRVTLDNPKWLPLVWLTVRFPLEPGGALRPEHRWETVELPEGGVQKPYYEKNVSFLLGHQRMSYTSRLQAEHRGLLSFDRIRLLSGDGLCLCVREKEIPLPRPVTLAVFPRLVPVSTRWFLRNSWELETGARGFQDDRTVIRNVRAYQPGDNARSLNFRLMARGQGAMVNIYEKISPRRAAFLLDGASFAGLPPEDFESALEILGSLAAQLMEEEVAVSLLISRPAGRLEQFATCRDRLQLPAVLTLLAAADTAVSITADEILPRLRTLSGAFLICGDVRRLDAGTCALLERHRVPLLAWGEQSHPLLRVLDLNAFRAGGGL